MLNRLKNKLVVLTMVLCFMTQSVIVAYAAFPSIGNFGCFLCNSICIPALLKKLGRVGDYTDLSAELSNFTVLYKARNQGGNASTAESANFGGDLIVEEVYLVDPSEVLKNGTADVELRVATDPDSALSNQLEVLIQALLPNPNWSLVPYDGTEGGDLFFVFSFDLRLVLTQDGVEEHIIEATCVWNESTGEWVPTVTYDSRA